MKTILQQRDLALRQISKALDIDRITSPDIQKTIDEMFEVLRTQKDGIALAAPQIGVNLRLFVVSGELLGQADPDLAENPSDLVFVNPKITKSSRKKNLVEEGCLSIRWFYGLTKRADKVTMEAYDRYGRKIIRGGSGILAQIFQHEIDHLDGVLFVDSAEEIWEMTPEEITQIQTIGKQKEK